ncbi:MAG: hypothetical protein M3Z01_01505 [Thermoproteota archaeon]|nr:hypothetical protein [Thermoproteota archaeon]
MGNRKGGSYFLKRYWQDYSKETGDDDLDIKETEDLQRQLKLKELSPYAQAFQMFKDKKSLVDVAINLDIETNLVLIFYADYLQQVNALSSRHI